MITMIITFFDCFTYVVFILIIFTLFSKFDFSRMSRFAKNSISDRSDSDPELIFDSDTVLKFYGDPELIFEGDRELTFDSDRDLTFDSDRELTFEGDPELTFDSDRELTFEGDPELTFDSDPAIEWAQSRKSPNRYLQCLPYKLMQNISESTQIDGIVSANTWTRNPSQMSQNGQNVATPENDRKPISDTWTHLSTEVTPNELSDRDLLTVTETQKLSGITGSTRNTQNVPTQRPQIFQSGSSNMNKCNPSTEGTQNRQNTSKNESTERKYPDIEQNELIEETHETFLIDKDLLPNKWIQNRMSCAVFSMNGEYFVERKDNGEEYLEFEVVTDSDNEDEEESPLPISIQRTRHGLLINSSLILSENQWNTIIMNDANLWCCVCVGLVRNTLEHINNDSHIKNIDKHRPLERFDLSIIRLINGKYHCGVCNEIFQIDDEDEHLNSGDHGIKQMYAINIATDFMWDEEERNTQSYFDFGKPQRETQNTTIKNSKEDCNGNDVDFVSNCLNLPLKYNENEDNDPERLLPVSGISYALAVKKPTIDVPKYLWINSNGRQLRVNYDSWNMVLRLKSNHFYCMACKEEGAIRLLTDHCTSKIHIDKLKLCHIVETYVDYLVRKIDDKFYHCGHCNNLQFINDISNHIEVMHPKKIKSIVVKHTTDGISEKRPSSENNLKHSSEYNDYETEKKNGNTNENNDKQNLDNDVTAKSDSVRKNDKQNLDNDVTAQSDSVRKNDKQNLDNDVTAQSDSVRNNDKQNLDNDVTAQSDSVRKNDKQNLDNDVTAQSDSVRKNDKQNLDNDVTAQSDSVRNNDKQNLDIDVNPKSESLCNNDKQNLDNDVDPKSDSEPDIAMVNKDTIVDLFGFAIKVSVLSFNVISETQFGYFCGICQTAMAKNQVLQHLTNLKHIHTLNNHNFIVDFGVNLFRLLPNGIHCTICHIILHSVNWVLKTHIQDGHHVTLLNKALGINMVPAIQSNTFNVQYLNPIKTNNQSDASTKVTSMYTDQSDLNQDEINQLNTQSEVKPVMHQEIVSSEKEAKHEIEDTLNQDKANVDTNQIKLNQCDLNHTNGNVLDSSEVGEIDTEEHVIVKLQSYFIKISITSFNSLVGMGDGSRYCFVCSKEIFNLKNHVESKEHSENMNKCKFIDVYNKNLIRQKSINYHCSICNVLFTKKYLQRHLAWSVHVESESLKTTKRPEDVTLKNHRVLTTKEVSCNQKEPTMKVFMNIKYGHVKESARKFKIIIFDGNVAKLTRDAWEGIRQIKNGYRCILCQTDLCDQWSSHVDGKAHRERLEGSFKLEYLPSLIREVSESTLNCLICNKEMPNGNDIFLHINAKRHKKKLRKILLESSQTDPWLNSQDVFSLR